MFAVHLQFCLLFTSIFCSVTWSVIIFPAGALRWWPVASYWRTTEAEFSTLFDLTITILRLFLWHRLHSCCHKNTINYWVMTVIRGERRFWCANHDFDWRESAVCFCCYVTAVWVRYSMSAIRCAAIIQETRLVWLTSIHVCLLDPLLLGAVWKLPSI